MRMVGALTAVPALIRRLGADPAAILAAIALDPAVLDHPSNRIAYADLARLLHEASERTGCPHFGLLVGREWHLSNLGLPGEAVRHAPTLGQGLEEFILSHHLNSEGAVTFLMQRSGVAEFGYALFVPLGAGRRHIYDAAVATGINMMRELCGDAWSPSEVLLAHTAPDDAEPYRQTFGAPVRFNSEYSAIRFPARWLDHRVAGADPERLRLVRAKTAAAGKATLPQSVARTLRTLLLHGKASGADVALSLAMHRRTLNRRLSDEGTTFQRVLDGVRLSVAKELLEDSAVSLPDIAAALGYGDYVSLIRAFRRWTGTTPGAWRTSSRAQAGRE